MELELTKKGTPRKRKQKEYYFSKDTENAILEYVTLTDQRKKDKLYKDRIDFPFFKLSQNIINTYKFPYMEGTIEDKQQEVIFHLLKGLNKFNPEKGAAYSYFGTAALRYCILENNKRYKIIKSINNSVDIEEINEENSYKSIVFEDEINNNIFNESNNYVIEHFIKYIERHIESKFIKDIKNKSQKTKLQELEDIKTAYSIAEIFKQRENIDIFNKKGVLLYIREMTDQNTQQITKVSKKLNIIYNKLNNQFLEHGYISFNI